MQGGRNAVDDRRKRKRAKWLSLMLCFLMVLGLFPQMAATVRADDSENTSISQEAIKAMAKVFSKAKGSTTGVSSSDRNLVLIGDSRTVGMYMTMTGAASVPNTAAVIETDKDGTTWSCRVGMGLNWMKSTGVPNAEAVIDKNSDVVITMGVNDYTSPAIIAQYAPYINQKAKEWKEKGANTFFCSIMPINGDNTQIEQDNETIKNGLSDDVTYIDTYSVMKDSIKFADTYHYQSETFKQWYNQIVSLTANQGSTSSANKILKETDLSDFKLEDMTCRRLNSNGKEKDPSVLKGKSYKDYTDTYTYVGTPEKGGSEEVEEAPEFKKLDEDDKKGTAVTVTFNVGNSSVTQTYYSEASGDQYLGEGTASLVPRNKKIVGWALRESNEAEEQGTGNEISYSTYMKLDKTAIENMAASGGESVTLYAVLTSKKARTKDDTIKVVTEDEYNGDLHDCFSSNPLSVQFAYVTEDGELEYTDKQDVTSYENQKTLYKTILAMAAVATDNQTNTVEDVSSSSSDTTEASSEETESSSAEADNVKTDEPEAYVKYCKEMAKKAIKGYQGYSVIYTPVLLSKVKGGNYDYTWEEDGTSYRATGARLSANVIVYVDANLESLCAQDTMGEKWFHDNGMPSISSVFGNFVDWLKGIFDVGDDDEEPVYWTKTNRGYAKDYLDMSDNEFQSWFHCDLNYGLSGSGAMIGTKYLEIMEQMAEGENYLYVYGAGRPAGTESKYVDCSSFVARALYVAGVIKDSQAWWTTVNMGTELVKLGFTQHKYTEMNDLQAGDILVVNDAHSQHTETYYGDGKLVGAHTDENAAADQVSIENFYEDGWQFYYRPPISMMTSIGTGTMTGNTVAEKLWSYFTSCGFSKTATAAIMGNAMAESSLNPTVGTVAYGLFQFEMGTGNANDYYAYAASKGKDIGDVQTQCEFLLKQLPGDFQAYTGHGVYTYDNGAQAWWPTAMTMEEWNQLNDVDLQTEIFERVYERASIPAVEKRQNYARQFYSQFAG